LYESSDPDFENGSAKGKFHEVISANAVARAGEPWPGARMTRPEPALAYV
jgi:hypothetical protein